MDVGLGGFLMNAGYPADTYMAEWGKQKVPTLRNVDLRPYAGFVKAYGHNGYFKSLEEIVHFYNTRDVATWPAPEVAENVNTDELGDLGLSRQRRGGHRRLHEDPLRRLRLPDEVRQGDRDRDQGTGNREQGTGPRSPST